MSASIRPHKRTSPTTSTGQTRTTTSHPKPTVEELVGVGTQEFGEVATRVDEHPEVTTTVSEPINEAPTTPVSSPTPSVSPEPTPTYYEAPSNNSYDSDVPVYSDTGDVSTTIDYETEPVTNTTIIQKPVMDVNDVPTIDTQQVEEEPVISPEPVNESNNHTARNIGLATLGIAAAAGAGTVAYKALEKKKQNEGFDDEDNK